MKYLTVVIQLPDDAVAASKVTKALPMFGDFHGGTVTAAYAGDAISENELFEERCGASTAAEIRRKVTHSQVNAGTDRVLMLLPPEVNGALIPLQTKVGEEPMLKSSASQYKQMIVARRENGEVEAAGWDCVATRKDAKEWLDRDLAIEIVTAAQVEAIEDDAHVFSTNSPVSLVLSYEQALSALSDSAIPLH